ncbi:unnamed protein product [Schistosoma intercalatum]|nr:unnamed protein product [Schistosoma intercalatum]CAH8565633.1 unnamed protein product [Schistosoma intercalatum]
MKKSKTSNVISTISQKQLKDIQGYFSRQNGIRQGIHENGTALGSLALKSKPSDNKAIVDSVLRDVIDRDKLPESSLVKVLTSVYLDAKSKLGANVSQDTTQQVCKYFFLISRAWFASPRMLLKVL